MCLFSLSKKVAMVYDVREKDLSQPVGLPLPISVSVGKSTTLKTTDIIACIQNLCNL